MEEATKEVTSINLHQHPDFQCRLTYYTDIENFLRPKHGVLKTSQYLWLHSFEDPDRQIDIRDKKMAQADRASREQRTEYINYLSMVANRIISLITKGGINFNDDIEAVFKDFPDNVDGMNSSLETYFASLFLDEITFGKSYCLINAATNQGVESLADEIEKKDTIRPYFVRLHPLDVKDWELDNSGSVAKFRYEYETLKARSSLREEPELNKYCEEWYAIKGKVFVQRYVSVNRQNKIVNYCIKNSDNVHFNWMLSGAEIVLDKLTSVPLSMMTSKHTWLEDVLPIVKKIYNKQSDLDNVIYSQGYDKTFIKAALDQATNGDGRPLTDEEKMVKIAHNSVTIIPPDSDVIKLDPTYPQAIFDSLKDDLIALFQIAFNMLRVSPPDSKMGEAADSRKELKEDLLTRINEKRTQYLSFIHKSVANFANFLNVNANYESKAEFVKSLEQSDIEDLVTLMRQTTDIMQRYPKWEKEAHKRLAQEMMLPDEVEILSEIDSTDLAAIREEEAAQMTAGITGLVNTKNKAGGKA